MFFQVEKLCSYIYKFCAKHAKNKLSCATAFYIYLLNIMRLSLKKIGKENVDRKNDFFTSMKQIQLRKKIPLILYIFLFDIKQGAIPTKEPKVSSSLTNTQAPGKDLHPEKVKL